MNAILIHVAVVSPLWNLPRTSWRGGTCFVDEEPYGQGIVRLSWRNLNCKHADPSVLAAVLRDTDHIDRHHDCSSCLTIALTVNITYRTATNTYGSESMLDPGALGAGVCIGEHSRNTMHLGFRNEVLASWAY